VAARLRAAGAGAPDPVAKHIRALGPAAEQPPELNPPETLPPDARAADVITRALALSVVRLIRHDAGVRLGGDPEDVHQARVATRRLRSDLRTFGQLLEPEWRDGLREEMKGLADLLGAVRDADVMLERLRRPLAGDRDRLRRARPLLSRVTGRRKRARAHLLQAMRSSQYVDLLEHLVASAQAPALLPAAEQPAIEVLPPRAAAAWAKLRAQVSGLGDKPADDELHAIRIAAKRARYAAEAVAPVVGRRAEDFASAVAKLQTVLGDFHDAVVLRDWLREVAKELRPEAAFVAGELAEMERELADECRDRWGHEWRKVNRKRLTGWMATH
jgi:CHAD domain-containing protein